MANKNIGKAGENTRFKKGSAETKKASLKGHATQTALAELRSSEAVIEADKNGTLASLFFKMLNALDNLYENGKMDSFLKHGAVVLEMVNGRQINIKADGNVKRDINIVLRRATPEDAK